MDDPPPPSYPFGLPVGVDEREWGHQWREWEARRAAKGIFGLSLAQADIYRRAFTPKLAAAATVAPPAPVTAPWTDVPNPTPPMGSKVWYACAKKWRLTAADTALGRQQMILEVGLNSGTVLCHILFIDQIQAVLTKSRELDALAEGGAAIVEEVIFDLNNRREARSYKPAQVKLKFTNSANALAFHAAVMDFLGGH
jgi:hypothetical protein